ncbi:uncharacterized protein LOC113338626 [Papaver somniferum]|uniref:uncharacterized protein LOC113338626 n=1 Tax=Papaver somniferum TaxID=3469 RepID=UPI000E6F8249|nr:uncharacterized protein LOC113338626 [Papaver somniferum]
MVKSPTVRVVLCLAITYNWHVKQLDVSNAFLHGYLDEEVYMSQPQGFLHPNYFFHYVCRLKKSLYGLKQAPRAWFYRFSSFLLKCGFKKCVSDSMFVKSTGSDILVLLLYVDDILLTGSSSVLISEIITSLKKEFAVKELGDLAYFLGIEDVRHSDSIVLTQTKYTLELLEKANLLDCKSCDTQVVKASKLSIHDGVKLDNPCHYRTLVGALQYLTVTRPDICFAVNYVSQFMHSPSDLHLQLVKRILRYLKETVDLGINLNKCDVTSLKAYTNSDWAGCLDTRRSTSGFAIFLGSNLVSWSSKKKPTISKSSAEAEYKCLSVASAELQWFSYLLNDLHVVVYSVLLLCDNTSALALATNPVFHARTKHIEIQYHTVRELVEEGFLKLQHISSEDQLADLFTKGLCFPAFSRLLSQLLGTPLSASVASSTSVTSSAVQLTEISS